MCVLVHVCACVRVLCVVRVCACVSVCVVHTCILNTRHTHACTLLNNNATDTIMRVTYANIVGDVDGAAITSPAPACPALHRTPVPT